MSFKDKPKREGPKPFARESKKNTGPRKPEGASSGPAKDGFKGAPKGASKGGPKSAGKPSFRKPALDAAAAAAPSIGKPERISKILARVGVASRRDVERMIMEGRVSLNGKTLETPVVNATLADKIEVDGQPIRGIERTRLWLYHKPAGLVTTNSDPEGRATVFDNLPEDLPRVLSIGRLDINTEGLLLLTNDGGLSRVLELPTTGWLRRYRVRAYGEVSQEDLDKLKDGIAVDGVLYGSIDATLDRTQGHNVWITMGLREGKNREIKNVLGALGLDVNRLIRISYGPFQLGDLPEGHVVEVRGRMLRDQLGPRLIEESKANFDAPVYNNPVSDDEKPQPKAAREDRREEGGWGAGRAERNDRGGERADRGGDRGERGGKPKREGGDRFGDKPKGARPAGKFGGKFEGKAGGNFGPKGGDRFDDERPKKRAPMGTSRTANVWMAPGARPTADGSGAKKSARAEAERLFTKEPARDERRVTVNRVKGDSDWIRAEEPAANEGFGGRGGRGGDRAERGGRGERGEQRGERGDRPFRQDRSERPDRGSDRPFRSERPDRAERSDRPQRSERPNREGSFEQRGERQERGERSFGRPQGDRFEKRERPSGDREGGRGGFGGKPSGERSYGGKPSGERSFGGKPSGERSFGGKPSGERSFGGKPAGKPSGKFGGKPGGGKPSGGRPGGKPAGGGRGPGSGPKGGGNRSRGPRG